jgi:hypothetical protein
VKSFTLKLSGHAEGPFSDAQIARMFADQRVNRDTPCKPVDGSTWKSIDDFLPMLNTARICRRRVRLQQLLRKRRFRRLCRLSVSP